MTATNTSSDGFTTVTRRSGSAASRSKKMPSARSAGFVYSSSASSAPGPSRHVSDRDDEDPERRGKKKQDRIRSIEKWLVELQSCAALLDPIREVWPPSSLKRTVVASQETLAHSVPTRILALGLGSLIDSRSAQIQLALLLLLVKHFQSIFNERSREPPVQNEVQQTTAIQVSAYDPVFTPLDGEILASFGVQLETEDKGGRYAFSFNKDEGAAEEGTTLAYMPHCGRRLYDRLLRSNWSRRGLSGTVLLCNRLDRYSDTIPTRRMREECEALHRFVNNSTSRPLLLPTSCSAAVSEALNDLSLQFWNEGIAVAPPLAAASPGGAGRAGRRNRKRPTAASEQASAEAVPDLAALTLVEATGADVSDEQEFWSLPPEAPVPTDAEGREVLH